MTITIYIDSDALTLGPSATQDDLDKYSQNLASHLAKQFPGNAFNVEQKLGGGRKPCPENDEVNEYVRELQSGDGWIDLL